MCNDKGMDVDNENGALLMDDDMDRGFDDIPLGASSSQPQIMEAAMAGCTYVNTSLVEDNGLV